MSVSHWSSVWNERGERRCSKCKQFKCPSEYYRRAGSGELLSVCKECHNAGSRARRQREFQRRLEVGGESETPAPPTGLAPYADGDDERRRVMDTTWRYFTR